MRRPLPDASAWARLSAWFDIGVELDADVRGAWLDALADDEPADLVAWLRDMLAAAGEDQAQAPPLPRSPGTAAVAAQDGEPGGSSSDAAGPTSTKSKKARKTEGTKTSNGTNNGKGKGAKRGKASPDAHAGEGDLPRGAEADASAPAEPAALTEPSTADASLGPSEADRGVEPRTADSPAGGPAADADPEPTEVATPIAGDEPPSATRAEAALPAERASGDTEAAIPAPPPAAPGSTEDASDDAAHPDLSSPSTLTEASGATRADDGAGIGEGQASAAAETAHAPEPGGLHEPPVRDRLSAPALATGMRLGPWFLVGPMPSTDARVGQWRARRADVDAQGLEVAVLVPWQWRPRADLAAWLAHAAARARGLVHPHIARILETGISDEGTPWIACELAEGQAIDRWCRDHSLAVPQRQALMLQALQAAGFAHGQLVVHGFIHPSQILLSPDGRLRFVNFGLAEVLAMLDVPEAVSTHGSTSPPPRAYAAPELHAATGSGEMVEASASRGAPSAAADVYALGLVAFEVLSGASPWQPRAPGKATAVAAGSRWPPPSDFAGTSRVRRALRGDLDAIVVKATQSEPAKRYPTAAELLDDLRRAMAHRPVSAMEGGFWYQVGCVARRHPRLASLATVGATLFVVLLGALSWKAWDWTQESLHAEAARRGSEAVTRLLRDLLHDAAQPGTERDWPETLTRAEAVARSSIKEPAALAAALALLGRQQAELGAFAEARNLLAEALQGLADPPSRMEAVCDEAWSQARQGDKPDEAEQRIRRVTENVAARPATRVLCLARLADLERRLGRARDAYATTFSAWETWAGSSDQVPQLALLLSRPMGLQSATLGRFHESQLWFEWAMKLLDELKQGRSLTAIELREQWGEISLAAGDAELALKLADDNLAALVGSPFPDDADPATAAPALMYLAAAEPRLELQRLADARARLERAIALAEARGDAPTRRRASCAMAVAALRERDAAAAERWLKAASAEPAQGQPRRVTTRPLATAVLLPSGSASAPSPTHVALVGLAPPTAAEEARRAEEEAQRRADHACRAAAIELSLLQGRPLEAQREAENLLAVGDALAPRLRATANLLRAEATLAARQTDRAVSAALQALQAARALHQSDVEDQKTKPSLRSGQAALLVAEAHRASGDLDEARKNLAFAQQQMAATLPESHPWRRRGEALKSALAVVPTK